MPAKKKTGDSTKVASRKSRLVDDPPVVVGGGGSVYVFIKSSATPVSPSPLPGYMCYQLPDDVQVLRISNGVSPRIITVPLRADRFGVNFDRS
jgi:hypothetical protein